MVPARLTATALAAAVIGLASTASIGAGQADTSALLERVSSYLTEFEKDYSHVMADERYTQTLKDKRVRSLDDKTTIQSREIKSDVLASVDLKARWLTFRDVYSVDGRPVRDRDARLQKLFESAAVDRFNDAARIAEESARFNVGTIVRTINMPSMPLTFFTSANRSRSAFREAGQERVAGLEAEVFEFQETARPTLVKSGPRDLPARGKFWVERATGRVLKASARFEARDFTSEMTVTFGPVEKLNMWAPAEMRDASENSKELITGFAVYTNYRRFGTSVIIK